MAQTVEQHSYIFRVQTNITIVTNLKYFFGKLPEQMRKNTENENWTKNQSKFLKILDLVIKF